MPCLIAIDGINGCGKSTVCEFVNKFLNKRGIKSTIAYEPDNYFAHLAKYGIQSDQIDEKEVLPLDNTERVFLWWIARHQTDRKYENSDYDVVLKDRHFDSTFVYQNLEVCTIEVLHFGQKEQIVNKYSNTSNLIPVNYSGFHFWIPLLTIHLDISPEIALQRMNGTRDDIYATQDLEKLEIRRKKYQECFNMRNMNGDNMYDLNVDNLTVDEMNNKCLQQIAWILSYDNQSIREKLKEVESVKAYFYSSQNS